MARSEKRSPKELGGSPIRLVIGLGNPGSKYAGTRHNVGFDLVDLLASEKSLDWRTEKKWKVELARTADGSLVLAKPQTFMNLSGEAVIKLASFYKIPPTEMLVVYDDADLPLGRLRFRNSGSAGGHNGVKSLIQHLGTDRIPRLKIGIGRRPGDGDDRDSMVGHVLGRFRPEESERREKSMARAAEAVNCALLSGLAEASTRYNPDPDAPTRPKPAPKRRSSADPKTNSDPSPQPEDNRNELDSPDSGKPTSQDS